MNGRCTGFIIGAIAGTVKYSVNGSPFRSIFSAFSLDFALLWERGAMAGAAAWSAGSLSAREKRTAPRNTSPPPKKKEKKPEDKKQQLDSRVVPSPERDRRAGLVEPTTFVVESPSL